LNINYCFFDPSKGKKGSDFPAPIWVNLINGRKYIFDAIDVKQDLDDLIKLIAKMNKEYKSKIMIFETNGCIGLEDSILRAHQDVGYHIAIEGIHETRNKHERIMSIQPDLYRPNNFYFRSDFKKYYPEMMNQIIFFPAWEHDDFPDIVEKAVTWLIKFSPGEFLNQTQMKTLTGTKNFAGSIKSTKKW
jgi:predicted phage terminase large subunit-like protein